jgi:hypothetical protein
MAADEPRKLTAIDPVDPETLATFNKLEEVKHDIAIKLLELEQDKVRLLATAHRVDEQVQRTFERVLVDRGLPPSTQVDIDSKSGQLTVRKAPVAEDKAES